MQAILVFGIVALILALKAIKPKKIKSDQRVVLTAGKSKHSDAF